MISLGVGVFRDPNGGPVCRSGPGAVCPFLLGGLPIQKGVTLPGAHCGALGGRELLESEAGYILPDAGCPVWAAVDKPAPVADRGPANAFWDCDLCGHANRWFYEVADLVPGPLTVVCDWCGRERSRVFVVRNRVGAGRELHAVDADADADAKVWWWR